MNYLEVKTNYILCKNNGCYTLSKKENQDFRFVFACESLQTMKRYISALKIQDEDITELF